MAKATAKSSSKASVKVVINERRPIRRRRVVQKKKMVELPPVRIYHEYFSQPTFAQLPPARPEVPVDTKAPPVGLGVRAETPIVGYTPPPQTPITIPDTTPQRSLGVMAQVAAEAKRKFDAQFSREPVPNVFPGSIEPRTLFANEALEQAFDAGHIVSRRGR
jgi:hypothetical protein